MGEEPQTPSGGRYSLRTRTPAKASPASVLTPAPRKRARTVGSSRGRGSSTPLRARGRGRGGSTRGRTTTKSDESSQESSSDASSSNEEEDEEVEDFDPKNPDPNATYKMDETVDAAPVRRGPGRPRKTPNRTDTQRRTWESRRTPVHLTKHDAFRPEYLDAASRILSQVPVESAPGDRYEQLKMSDALKVCGYELGVAEAGSEPVQEAYRVLAWCVHAAGPSAAHAAPPLSEAGKTVLLRVFASIGCRIREETRDMAGYHRRHALRKLVLAGAEGMGCETPREGGEAQNGSVHETPQGSAQETQGLGHEMQGLAHDTPQGSANGSLRGSALRRNPLRIPGPLIDIWKEPYKKPETRTSMDRESQVST
ncbi:hypothetical protein IWW56_000550 [Coemansia sp. RSA 2131]|nr:hypothetical protein IWW56_000550 [Coemansia sp. RSA 2131]